MSAGGYSAQLTRKRAAIERRLSHAGETCDIVRPDRTLDASGRPTGDETTVASGVKCLLAPATNTFSGREREVAGEVVSLAGYVLVVPWDTSVEAQDEAVFSDGRRFSIIGVVGDVTTRFVRELNVVEVNPTGSGS